MERKNAIITGGVGFIGSHLSERLLKEGFNKIYLVDNLANRSSVILVILVLPSLIRNKLSKSLISLASLNIGVPDIKINLLFLPFMIAFSTVSYIFFNCLLSCKTFS